MSEPYNQDKEWFQAIIIQLMEASELSERQTTILKRRMFGSEKFTNLAKEFSVSPPSIRQSCSHALRKLQTSVDLVSGLKQRKDALENKSLNELLRTVKECREKLTKSLGDYMNERV